MKIFRIVVAVFWSGTLLWLTAMLMGDFYRQHPSGWDVSVIATASRRAITMSLLCRKGIGGSVQKTQVPSYGAAAQLSFANRPEFLGMKKPFGLVRLTKN